MRRIVRKRIRRTGDGLDLVADLNVEISTNVGRSRVPEAERPDDDEHSGTSPRQPDEEGKEP